MNTAKTALGLILLSLTLSACSSSPVKTETVTVYVPKIVQVPDDLVRTVPVPDMAVKTNSDMADLIIKLKAALEQANRQLEAIDEL